MSLRGSRVGRRGQSDYVEIIILLKVLASEAQCPPGLSQTGRFWCCPGSGVVHHDPCPAKGSLFFLTIQFAVWLITDQVYWPSCSLCVWRVLQHRLLLFSIMIRQTAYISGSLPSPLWWDDQSCWGGPGFSLETLAFLQTVLKKNLMPALKNMCFLFYTSALLNDN